MVRKLTKRVQSVFRIKSCPVDPFIRHPSIKMNVPWVPRHSFQEQSTEGIWRGAHHTQGNDANTKMRSQSVPGRYRGGFGTGDIQRGSNVKYSYPSCQPRISIITVKQMSWYAKADSVLNTCYISAVLSDVLKLTLAARTLTELWGSLKLLSVLKHVHGMTGNAPQQLWCWHTPRTSQCSDHPLTSCKTTVHQHNIWWTQNNCCYASIQKL